MAYAIWLMEQLIMGGALKESGSRDLNTRYLVDLFCNSVHASSKRNVNSVKFIWEDGEE